MELASLVHAGLQWAVNGVIQKGVSKANVVRESLVIKDKVKNEVTLSC